MIERLERRFLEGFLQLVELKCVVVEEKQVYLHWGRDQKLSHALTSLRAKRTTIQRKTERKISLTVTC